MKRNHASQPSQPAPRGGSRADRRPPSKAKAAGASNDERALVSQGRACQAVV